jgi:hypothetical protein
VVITEGDEAGSSGELGKPLPPAEITLYPKTRNGLSPQQHKEMRKLKEGLPNSLAGCAVGLAHELGHALGASDNPNRGNNVWNNEDPVRKDFRIKLRNTYRGIPIVPSPK